LFEVLETGETKKCYGYERGRAFSDLRAELNTRRVCLQRSAGSLDDQFQGHLRLEGCYYTLENKDITR
jgi:hypothetical protein